MVKSKLISEMKEKWMHCMALKVRKNRKYVIHLNEDSLFWQTGVDEQMQENEERTFNYE